MGNFTVFNLVCPYCVNQNSVNVDLDLPSMSVTCVKCNSLFSSRVVKARSRNSRHVASKGKGINYVEERHFSIRIKDFRGGEDLIEFANAGRGNFEFRSGDTVAFTYIGNRLALVQNFTIGQWMKVGTTSPWKPLIIALLLLIVVTWMCKGC